MSIRSATVAAILCAAAVAVPAAADEEPKRGGTLTFMIPADAPPSFDAHREETYATIHAAAPFYSVLIRANPYDPGKTDDLVCDLCTAMPKPTDDGKTYTFKIREGVKFTDGAPLTADDIAASWSEIIFPPDGACLELSTTSNGKSDPVALKVANAVPPLTLLVNGVPKPAERRGTLFFQPGGPGFSRVTVMDASGATDSVVVRLDEPARPQIETK